MDTEVSSFVESEGVREHIRDEGEERGLGKPGTRKLVSRELAPVSSLQGCGRGREKRTENKNKREREKMGAHLPCSSASSHLWQVPQSCWANANSG